MCRSRSSRSGSKGRRQITQLVPSPLISTNAGKSRRETTTRKAAAWAPAAYHLTILPYYHITISSYYHIIILSYYHITILPYYHITISSYYHITILPYFKIGVEEQNNDHTRQTPIFVYFPIESWWWKMQARGPSQWTREIQKTILSNSWIPIEKKCL